MSAQRGATTRGRRAALALAALGVVYGDIGTSPLYAVRESFVGAAGFPVTPANVLGILSLILWSLVLVVSVQFVMLVLRADNQGEGGLLALAHLLVPEDDARWGWGHRALVALGVFGAALLFGDGIITPALSVLSAMEGLRVVAPELEAAVVPATVAILLTLFAIQRFGTDRVGRAFGPIMLLWFVVLGALGVRWVVEEPGVLAAVDPRHAWRFFADHGWHGTLILGAVFLTVTGAEALYADLGHFGRGPIQRSWYAVVLPGLALNYLGQGALLLQRPELVHDVFYRMAPPRLIVPLVVLATLATVIASQAVVSGVFSLTAQAVRSGWLPRAEIVHTSARHRGQVFVPIANKLLLAGTVGLVLAFRSSGGLADAYGIAVSLTMLITTLLFAVVLERGWGWPRWATVGVSAVFVLIDLAFLGALARKVWSGGWIPLLLAGAIALLMLIWRRGRARRARAAEGARLRIPDGETPAIVLVSADRRPALAQPPTRPVLWVDVHRCARPHMVDTPHGTLDEADGQDTLHACYGFMDRPDLPELLRTLHTQGALPFAPEAAEYFRVMAPAPGATRPWHRIEDALYAAMARRAARLVDGLGVPAERIQSLMLQKSGAARPTA
jgi:KUP system potassium uptake protein